MYNFIAKWTGTNNSTAWPRKRWIRVVWASTDPYSIAYIMEPVAVELAPWLHIGLSSQPLTPAKRWQNFEIWSRGTSCSNRCLWYHYQIALGLRRNRNQKLWCTKTKIDKIPIVDCRIQHTWQSKMLSKWCKQCTQNLWFFQSKCPTSHCNYFF